MLLSYQFLLIALQKSQRIKWYKTVYHSLLALLFGYSKFGLAYILCSVEINMFPEFQFSIISFILFFLCLKQINPSSKGSLSYVKV